MVVENEILGIGPVVGHLALVVVAHHVGLLGPTHRARRVVWVRASPQRLLLLADKAVHLGISDVGHRVGVTVGASAVHVVDIVEGLVTATPRWVGDTNGGHAVLHRDAVGAGERPEIAVERAVLLHHDDHMADLVDAGRDDIGAGRPPAHFLDGASHADMARGTRRATATQDQESEGTHHKGFGPGRSRPSARARPWPACQRVRDAASVSKVRLL
jgi:hypothetical protein